jgi:hypothetical protein
MIERFGSESSQMKTILRITGKSATKDDSPSIFPCSPSLKSYQLSSPPSLSFFGATHNQRAPNRPPFLPASSTHYSQESFACPQSASARGASPLKTQAHPTSLTNIPLRAPRSSQTPLSGDSLLSLTPFFWVVQ